MVEINNRQKEVYYRKYIYISQMMLIIFVKFSQTNLLNLMLNIYVYQLCILRNIIPAFILVVRKYTDGTEDN